MSKGLRWASALAVMVVLATPAEAKTFRWANDGDANSMDPYARQETFLLLFDMSMYEPLVRRNREMKLMPGLATDGRMSTRRFGGSSCGRASSSMTARRSPRAMLSSPTIARPIPAPMSRARCRL
jgi:hypothetical protein